MYVIQNYVTIQLYIIVYHVQCFIDIKNIQENIFIKILF